MKALKTIGFILLLLLFWLFGLFSICLFIDDVDTLARTVIIYFIVGIGVMVFAAKWFINNGYRINNRNMHLSKHGESIAQLSDAKLLAAKINSSCIDVNAFCNDYHELCKCMDRLIWLNEKRHVSMEPKPRLNKDRIVNNLPATINDFIDRSVAEINSASGYAAVINWLNALMHNEEFKSISSKEVEAHINSLLYGGFEECKSELDMPDTLMSIDNMEGLEFEYWCADLLRGNGYTDVEVTQGSGDQGVDIIAVKDGIRYAIQCKCYHSNLGNTPVQEVNTGKVIYHCHVGVVMTNRYFTTGAKKAADATGVLLWDRDYITKLLETRHS